MPNQFSAGTFSTGNVKAILGPTNTGKTHYAVERILAHRSGMIGLPLRLLAREVYQRLVDRVGTGAVALITGEERITPKGARYWVATVEAMPTDLVVECVAVDEIQTATHFDRGHIFTDRILNARGTQETLLLGAATMAPIIAALLPNAEIIMRPRFSELTYAGSKKITRQPSRSAIVAFSSNEVYAIAELIRRQRGGAAVVMGALSPRTRNAQVELYENGEVDFLVATDAIGMGLNLDIKHVAFAADMKFDGKQMRPLTPAEFSQIAGRAGRHKRDGTFGVTGGAEGFSPELVEQLESHQFDAVKMLQWRNTALDFSSFRALQRSLDKRSTHNKLTNVPVAKDQLGLEFLMRHPDIGPKSGKVLTQLAWECASIPDYRNISPAQHGEIIATIFANLAQSDTINEDWIAEQVRFCDNANGEIDTLSNRIKQIRTWTFVANRKNWLKDPTYWREKTKEIENSLSDALHKRLMQRFIDRRTSVLMRHLRDKQMTAPEVSQSGEVSLEGQAIGSIEGFRFTLSSQDGGETKNLRSAASVAIAPEIKKRAEKVTDSPNDEFVLTADGLIRWRGEVIAELSPGDDILTPRLVVLADESLTGPDLGSVQDRLDLWLRHAINTQLEQLIALKNPTDLDGTARGVAFRLSESLGVIPRTEIADDVKSLDQDVRGAMRKMGIKFGAYHIYLPLSLKPAPREIALILWALQNGGVRQPGVRELPQIILSGRTSIDVDPDVAKELYEIAGFKVTGNRAVRVDILERLADLIRPLIAFDPKRNQDMPPEGAADGNGFRVTVEMTSLLGCAGEEFSTVLESLGYKVTRTPVEPTAVEPTSNDNEKPADAAADADQETAGVENAEPAVEAANNNDGPAPTVAAETDEKATADTEPPAEPQFDEVWHPAPRRNNKQFQGKKRDQNRNQNAQGKGQKAGKPNNKAAQHQKRNSKPAPKSKPIDPDSPFAALAALKK
ncbi:helicase-related protein [Maritalea sp.]|uniref:helicase-related protein n=1 Tax=Maritalea sp. TaxID=2003361 RepID=UPI003EFB3548